MDRSKAKERKSNENASEPLPPQPKRKKKKTEVQRFEKAFDLLTACVKPNCERRVSTFRENDSRKIKEL